MQFTNVLHVPDLQNNLLSVLYLTQYKQFSVVILETVMNFLRSGSVLFTAAVNASNCAYLEGSTIPIPSPVTNSALISSTLPLDTSLLLKQESKWIDCEHKQEFSKHLE